MIHFITTWAQRKKSKFVKSGEHAGHLFGQLIPTHRSGEAPLRYCEEVSRLVEITHYFWWAKLNSLRTLWLNQLIFVRLWQSMHWTHFNFDNLSSRKQMSILLCTIGNIVLIMGSSLPQIRPYIWFCYIDDTFVLWEYCKERLNSFLS